MNLDPVPNEFVVDIADVCNRLSRIKLNKAVGPDCIPNKILKQMAHIIGPPLQPLLIVHFDKVLYRKFGSFLE